jgi:hypothetical protein
VVEQSIAGGGGQKREADTTYAVGDVVTYDGLPMDWVLVCIVGGTSGSADITIPSPRVEGARILDGTVTWALRKIATYGGVGYRQSSTACSAGSIAFSAALPAGWYLESTTGGTTSAGDLIITSPTVGATVTDGTVVWTIRKVADTTDATTTKHGLMSASDKTKLNGIEANANNYSLPTASSSTLGGVKTGSNITNSSGTISLSKANVTSALGYTPPTTNTTYSTGTASTSGITKLYTGLGDNTDGTMTQKAIKATIGKGYLTDSYHNAATGDWYRVYSDGWVEQGGRNIASSDTEKNITFLKPMKNALYGITMNLCPDSSISAYTVGACEDNPYNLTSTGFKFQQNTTVNKIVWTVSGMGA